MDERKPTLDYGHSPKPTRGIMVGVLGLVLGIISVPMLIIGAAGIVTVFVGDVLRHQGGVDTAEDFVAPIAIFLIGLVCGIAALRWLRGAR